MNNKALAKGITKISMVVLASALLGFFTITYILPVLANTHTATVSLEPAWSPANSDIDFSVEFCKLTGDNITEVRIYKSWDGSIYYTNFECEDKAGWEKLYISTYPACFYVADDTSPEYDPLDEDGECETFYFSAHSPGPEYCNLTWKFETRDINEFWQFEYDKTSVDDKKPIITKDFVGSNSGPCPPSLGEECWVSIGTMTTIKISVVDDGVCGKSGLDYCKVTYTIDGGAPIEEVYADLNGEETWQYDMKFKEDSLHVLNVECKDIAGNILVDEEKFRVDGTPPETTKDIEPDPYIKNGAEYIDTVNTITLTSVDPDPTGYSCNIGVDGIYWANIIVRDEVCYDPNTYCEPTEVDYQFTDGSTVQITKDEESCHLLQYYAVDELGNAEEVKTNCFFVDKTKPVLDKIVGTPSVEGNHDTVDWWVTKNTPIDLYCQDTGPHPSGDVTIFWKYTVDGGMPVEGSYKGEKYTLNFPEDSVHELEFWCIDAVEKESVHDIEIFKVDTVPPEITKTMIGTDHLGECPPGQSPTEPCYVRDDGQNGVHVDVEDGGDICAVDDVKCVYELWWMGNVIESDEFGEAGTDIIFKEDSEHILKINCKDALGNAMVEDVEVFLVDSTPPETTKTYGTPYKLFEGNEWITSSTPITLTAVDEKVGVDVIQYRVSGALADKFCYECENWMQSLRPDIGPWNEYSAPFTIAEDSCHVIEFRSIDKLSNEEEIDWQCVFVDNKAPVTVKTFDGKVIDKSGTKYISQDTTIKLTCSDQDPHPVDHSTIWYRYRFAETCDGLGNAVWSEWIDSISGDPTVKDIKFTEDSCHELEYYCVDALENKEVTQSEIDIVDTKAPVITKSLVGPWSGDCLPESVEDECYIDGVTKIHVEVTDQDPHPVNDVLCSWDYEVTDGDKSGQGQTEITPPFDIQFQEESTHILKIKCWDALGNEVTDEEKFLVDKTPPEIIKTYGTPFVKREFQDYWADWISSDTPINVTVTDVGKHLSGIKEVLYRTTVVDDEYCKNYNVDDLYKCEDAVGTGDWKVGSEMFDFKIPEESCHLIEIQAKDNVDKTSTHKQCVFVDNTGPEADKIISDPVEEWEGDDTFYPGLKARCAAGEIDCWKVTMGTKLSIGCKDPDPHPVDQEKMCFQIELDADDTTERYCGEYNGTMNNGWCCLGARIEDFYFLEESQHDLKIQCEDTLGNKGEIDEEKFKVEGCPFDICLHKKWNLISVPFALFNDDPEAVFEDVEGNISAVWAYDNGVWYLWEPTLGGTLDSIKPGYGYWVLAKGDGCIEIAGSLMSPRELPPTRTLQPGWNLIGYYGKTVVNGKPTFQVDTDNLEQCNMMGSPVYCALNSLIDTQEGFPKWSSLYAYYNYGSDNAYWDGLDACINGNYAEMIPGQGYWIEMDVQDNYAPATNCIWNTDLTCGGYA